YQFVSVANFNLSRKFSLFLSSPHTYLIHYIYDMELGKISCDSVNRIYIPSLLDRSLWFDEECANNGIFAINGKLKMLRDRNEGLSTIPGFSQIQFEGFCRFIDQGLMEELYKFPKIEDIDQEIEFQLFVETYQLVEPLIKERDAVYESLTYSSELYVPAGLIWKTGRDIQEQTIFIGNIPLMNSLGTSIVNGIYRIVINQILQSPGIYYRSELDHNGISVYTATIISDWGGRSELEIDRK